MLFNKEFQKFLEKIKKIVIKIDQKLINEMYEDLLLDVHNLKELLGIKENEESNRQMTVPTMLSAVEEYPISYDFDRSESIAFLESFYKKNKKTEKKKVSK